MRLLSAIYEKCNGEQFEAVSELDFYASMNLLGIDDTYYKSKYKEPVSDFPSDSNREFAKEMRSIFR